jgi:hypothetical protein
LEALIDAVESKYFFTQEECEAWMERQHEKIQNTRIKPSKIPKMKIGDVHDPVDAFLKEEEPIESMYSSNFVLN